MACVTMKLKEKIPISKEWVESFKTVGSNIIAGCRDNNIYVVDIADNLTDDSSRVVKAYEKHTKRVTGVEYASNGDKIVSVGADNKLIIWDKNTKQNFSVSGHNKPIRAVALNSENNKIVTASEDGSFILWNVIGKQISVFNKTMEHSHQSFINACAFVPKTSDTLVTGSEDGTVKIWDLNTQMLMKTFIGGKLVDYESAKINKIPAYDYNTDMAVKAISISLDGSLLAYGGSDCNVYLINLSTNETVQEIPVPNKIYALASAETQPLMAISIPNKILVWNIIQAKMVEQYVFSTIPDREYYCTCLSFVGDELIAGLYDGSIIRLEMSRN